MSNNTLPKLIKDITLHYVKFYYDKHLKENNIIYIEEEDLKNLIDRLYNEKQKDLREYIRSTLKDNLKDQYPKITVENILVEMFDDQEYAKQRVMQEIILFQNNNKNK